MNELIISWITNGIEATYFVNNEKVGCGENGFQKVLRLVDESKNIKKIMIRYPAAADNGGDAHQYFPFLNQYEAFQQHIQRKNVLVEYVPIF